MPQVHSIALWLVILSHTTEIAANHVPTCVSASCYGLEDGDYESCKGCCVYVTCMKDVFYDDRPCVGGTTWDDSYRSCRLTSDTCTNKCVSSCDNLPDGDYNSCQSCAVYATCASGRIIDNRPCPADLVFDGNRKRCEKLSPTCC